jgi:hypothetical protein
MLRLRKIAAPTLSSPHVKFFVSAGLSLTLGTGCAIFATRPTQEMSDTTVAIRAAREVQADVLAPELYREAQEWYFRAKQEYKFKNFLEAKEYLDKAKKFAEEAEFQAIQDGASRTAAPPDPLQNDGSIKPSRPAGTAEADTAPAMPPGRDAGYEDKNKPIYMDGGAGGGTEPKSSEPSGK